MSTAIALAARDKPPNFSWSTPPHPIEQTATMTGNTADRHFGQWFTSASCGMTDVERQGDLWMSLTCTPNRNDGQGKSLRGAQVVASSLFCYSTQRSRTVHP